MPAYEDSFRQIEEALKFYAWCPMTDGTNPPAPNPMLLADNGRLAQAALKALDQLRDEFGALKMDTFSMLKQALRPPAGLDRSDDDEDCVGVYQAGDR